jgi:molecular chaperone DnaK
MNLIQQLAAAAHDKPARRVIGIDLGTTNSTVAQVQLPISEGASPDEICDCISIEQPTLSGPQFSTLVPSVVAIDREGKTWIGEGAKRMRSTPAEHGLSPEKNLFHDTKNDMGLRKRYHRAPEDYDHARKVAGHLLRFLSNGARQASGHIANRTVVTVPASFQISQRNDTLAAAEMAGLQISEMDLLDEPVAALTDYLFSHADEVLFKEPANIVVFDFGGGTCDVFVARIRPRDAWRGLEIEPKAVSRYHRLGGYDFDAAIIHDVLIPAILEENGLGSRHFEWGERKRALEPALRGCAEALKEGLCREIAQLHLHGRYQAADKQQIAARQMATAVKIGDKEYLLAQPTLTAARWEELLKPFLDPDLLHVKQTDYVQMLSIFAPLSDAIERANLPEDEVNYILLAGGSSLIPQVQWAIQAYFAKAKLLVFPDSTAAQTAIARGAAWSAAWLEATGEPLVRPVISSAIALRVKDRPPIALIEKGSDIPFPKNGEWARSAGLRLPRDFKGLLKVEVVSMPDEQVLLHLPIELDRKHAGTPLTFEYRFAANHNLECRVALQNAPHDYFEADSENPLVNVADPGAARQEIEEIEEELRDAGGLGAPHRGMLIRLSQLYRELRMLEKAAEVLKSASRIVGQADAEILNLQGINYEQMGDYNRMEACYMASSKCSSGGSSLFNWALHCYRLKRYEDALQKADEAIVREPESGPYLVLRARILQALKKPESAAECAQEALALFDELPALSEWAIGWYESCATILKDSDGVRQAKEELAARRKKGGRTDSSAQAPEYIG